VSANARQLAVLFVGAHPDDETIMAAGTLAMLRQHGVRIHLLCATDGRGGESGGVPGINSPADLARVRECELRCVADALEVDSLTLLGYEDPVMGPNEKLFGFAADDDRLARQIADVIDETNVAVVLGHGSDGEYGHPAHVQMHRATLRAIQEHAPDVLFYSGAALLPDGEDRLWNRHDPAHVALDITPWIETKHAAMLCHRTQHALFMRRRKLSDVRDAIRVTESFHRHWPAAPGSPPDDLFTAWLLDAGAWRPAETPRS
jgi:LmbE family N-acetylglucosaminyl deacetylase